MFRVLLPPASGFARLTARLARGLRNESGAVAIWFAVLALPIAVLGFGLIDVNRASVEKRHLQDALDAATLLAARSTATTDAQLQTIGAAALNAQLNGVSEATLAGATFKLVGKTVTGAATAKVTPVIANLWLQGDMTIGAKAEVTRSSTNLEVSIVLDITGSMAGTRLTDLKTAANDLIDLVVSDTQTPFYSKAAIVPYSIGVNVGSSAPSVRGATIGAKAITGAAWTTGSSKTITGATRANPVVISSNGHGFSNGDVVWISGVSGMSQINNRAFVVANKTTNSFQLSGVNGSAYNSYSSGGTIRKCRVSDCGIVITSASHGLNNGDTVYITGVGGMTQINNTTFTVANSTASTFSLAGVNGANYGTYSSGGSSWCTAAGCDYYQFTSATGTTNLFQISNCVSERTGTAAYTDAAPGGAPVGRNYPSTANPCPTSALTPLSSDKTTLKSQVTGLAATGSTAGQIGIAWGWYMVSPNFASLWPAASRPAAYGTKDLLKVVVIMTDGDFNTPYCNGVIAKDAGTGSGATSDHINCNATNGNPVTQGLALCTAMKAQGVVVYTVGFDVGTGTTAETLMKGCATSAANVYLPSSGTALKDAFAAIGRDITKLRLSK